MAALVAMVVAPGRAAAEEPMTPAAILQEMRYFREMGRVLYIAAHPDDENNQLITFLARGRGHATAYLSLTRGDGGQNLLGPEFREALGVARTQELIAARRIDGGRQFFTRAVDFGFSKDHEETFSIWDRQAVLGDVVRLIRSFRPDVLITRFSPEPGGTHGHHTASAVLGLEAFKLAGDPKAFPEQLGELTPWQPERILQNGRWRSGENNGLSIEVDGTDPVLGVPLSEIAGRSRSMHKTQGFGESTGRPRGDGPRMETFQLLDGKPAARDIMDGVDTTWARVSGGAEIGELADALLAGFKPDDPAASIPSLLDLRRRLAKLPPDRVLEEKHRQLDRIVQACLGLSVETTIASAEAVPGETLALRHEALVRATSVPVRWIAVGYPATSRTLSNTIALKAGTPAVRETTQTLPASTPLTHPYWLREEGTVGMFKVSNPALIGLSENSPAFPVEQVFEVGGQLLVIRDEPVEAASRGERETRRRLDVIPPVSLGFPFAVDLFAPGASRTVEVAVKAHRPDSAGTLQLEAPSGWAVSPASASFDLAAVGDEARVSFKVTAPAKPDTALITARAEIGGVRTNSERVEIDYAHIPFQLLQPPARLKAVCLDLAIKGRLIGYVPGAGDGVASSLAQMGYAVTELSGADLTQARLSGFDAVVIGVRAFNTREDLRESTTALFAYVEAGGTVVAQYNNPRGLQASALAPYTLQLSGDRVTNENAVVTILAPDHPALTTPNRIGPEDFAGWVQERGLYFPNQWDAHFTALLSCHDAGEAPTSGGLLVARHGKGYFVYTGLAFFRQLPAGVPGAYRLFANLVSLGK